MNLQKTSHHLSGGIIIARLLLFGLVGFEFLNLIGVLHWEIDFTWIGLMLTVVVAWSVLELINYWLVKSTGKGIAAWAYLAATFAIYLDALGDINRWYSTYIHYDQVAHFIGGMATATIIGYVVLRIEQAKKIRCMTTFFLLTVLAMTMALGSLYEIEEYLEDYFRGTNRLGDAQDTVNDMLLNTIGAIVVVIIIFFIRKKQQKVDKRLKEQ